jgi:hypothetical protein
MGEESINHVESALFRQVEVNADLRTSVVRLKKTLADLLRLVQTCQEQNFDRFDRITDIFQKQVGASSDLSNSVAKLQASVDEVVQIVQIYQEKFESLSSMCLQNQMQFEEYQRTTSETLNRVALILDHLTKQ